MERVIKFRALSIIGSTMIYGSLIRQHVSAFVFDEHYTTHEVAPETIGQFTGLTDKNGKEIYEGDIVKVGGLIELVRYIDGILCCFSEKIYGKHKHLNIEDSEELVVTYSDYFDPYEVIGNIHENPETCA